MSSERDQSMQPVPPDSVMTCTYDSTGRVTSVQDGPGRTWHYPYTGPGVLSAPPTARPDAAPAAAGTSCQRHAFEFRLAGSETQQQTQALEGLGAGARIVAIERVRAFFTGDGAAGAPASEIGGVEVHAELTAAGVVCTAQLSDFRPGDLLVVQVDLAVHSVG